MIRKNYCKAAALFIGSILLFSGCSIPENTGTEEDYTAIQGEDCQDEIYEQGKEVIERIRENDWEGEDVGFYSGQDNVSLDHKITVYKDQDFLYAVFGIQGGMSQLYGGDAYSVDGGDVWHIRDFHKPARMGDMYFLNGTFLEVEGIGTVETATPLISFDYGESYESIDCSEAERIAALPGIGGLIYAKAQFIDETGKTVGYDWYTAGSEIPFYSMEISYDTGEILNETDIYGLGESAEKYAESGYIFEDSSESYLNQEEVERRFFYETMITQDPACTAQEIRYAINEIYARKNYDFTGTEYEQYFQSKSWYSPAAGKTVQEEELNGQEKETIDVLADLEEQYKNFCF